MADQVFVDPITEAALGTLAMGVVPAGTASAEFEVEHRYRWGQSGAGHNQTAYILYTSTDGGVTWTTDSTEFTLRASSALNPGSDPLFLGRATAEIPTSRLDVAPLRSGCGYRVAIKCRPSLRPGAAREPMRWKLGVLYNETYRAIGLNPDAPSGVLSGIGDQSVREWVAAPTLTPGTDEVSYGDCSYVFAAELKNIGAGSATLNQNDSAAAALASGQEYIAVLSVGAAGTVTVTKGVKATAGSAAQPSYPTGELPMAVVRVPYGGVIAAATLVAVSGRCLVSDAGGLIVTVQPGRAQTPEAYLTPSTVQSLTLPDDATSVVYLSIQSVANLVEGIPLAEVTTAGGDITGVTDLRPMLYQGQRLKLLAQLEGDGQTINDAVLVGTVTLTSNADADGYGIVNLNRSGTKTDAASVEVVYGRSVKRPGRAAATSNVASLSGEQTVDGIALTDGQRVLLAAQSTAAEIGCWYVRSGAWERPRDNDDSYQVYPGIQVVVTEGSNRGIWVQTGTWGAEVWVKAVALP